MGTNMAEETVKANETSPARDKPAPTGRTTTPPKLRYQDIPDLKETFADSIGQWIFDGQMLRIEFTVTRLDPGGTPEQTTGRRLPAARMVLTPMCAVELIRQCQQLMAALEKAAAGAQQATTKAQTPAG